MTAADITWNSYAWPTVWLADTDALSLPAPAPEAESMPLYDAALAAHLAAGGTHPIPFAERVCGTCGATGKAPCVTRPAARSAVASMWLGGEDAMTGPEHYREAERLLHYADERAQFSGGDAEDVPALTLLYAEAQVHATLALAAATAPTAAKASEIEAWREVTA